MRQSSNNHNIVLIFITFLILTFSASLSAQQATDCDCKYSTGIFALNQDTEEMPTSKLPLMNSSYKSESKAVLFSLVGTTVPFAASLFFLSNHEVVETYPNESLHYRTDKTRNSTIGGLLLFTGLYVGPSLGHFYAERPMHALGGIGLRTGLTLVTFTGAYAACPWDCYSGDKGYDLATGIIIVGSTLFTGSIIYDIVTADNSVRKHNDMVAQRISIQPTYAYQDNTVGLSLKYRF